MFSKIIPTTALLAGQAAATIYYAGVAESGGEFGVYSMVLHVLVLSLYENNGVQVLQERLVPVYQARSESTTSSSTRAPSTFG
jgi:hypothetical protein